MSWEIQSLAQSVWFFGLPPKSNSLWKLSSSLLKYHLTRWVGCEFQGTKLKVQNLAHPMKVVIPLATWPTLYQKAPWFSQNSKGVESLKVTNVGEPNKQKKIGPLLKQSLRCFWGFHLDPLGWPECHLRLLGRKPGDLVGGRTGDGRGENLACEVEICHRILHIDINCDIFFGPWNIKLFSFWTFWEAAPTQFLGEHHHVRLGELWYSTITPNLDGLNFDCNTKMVPYSKHLFFWLFWLFLHGRAGKTPQVVTHFRLKLWFLANRTTKTSLFWRHRTELWFAVPNICPSLVASSRHCCALGPERLVRKCKKKPGFWHFFVCHQTVDVIFHPTKKNNPKETL